MRSILKYEYVSYDTLGFFGGLILRQHLSERFAKLKVNVSSLQTVQRGQYRCYIETNGDVGDYKLLMKRRGESSSRKTKFYFKVACS